MFEPWVLATGFRHFGAAKDTTYRWIETRDLPAAASRVWSFKLSDVDAQV
jgi:hypothetical protein